MNQAEVCADCGCGLSEGEIFFCSPCKEKRESSLLKIVWNLFPEQRQREQAEVTRETPATVGD